MLSKLIKLLVLGCMGVRILLSGTAFADIPTKPTHFVSCTALQSPTWTFGFMYYFQEFDSDARAAEVVVLKDANNAVGFVVAERFRAPAFELDAAYSIQGGSIRMSTKHLRVDAGRSGQIELTRPESGSSAMTLKSTLMNLNFPQGVEVDCFEDILIGPRPAFSGSN